MKNWHYLNNQWVTSEDLKISGFDLAVTRGFGVFDFLRTYKRYPFMLEEHINRFFNSARFLNLKIPKTKKEIEKIVFEGIRKNSEGELNIKMILTGGETVDGITPVGKHLLLVTFTPAFIYPEKLYQKGVKIITVKGKRFLPMAKYLNYTEAVLAMMKAKKQKAEEALYVDEEGRITEATRCNFFVVMAGRLVTPKKGILLGITRQVVLLLAKKLTIPVEEKDIFISQIKDFDEAFITASNKEIVPVVVIDDKKIGGGEVGKITKKLIEEFKIFTQNDVNF